MNPPSGSGAVGDIPLILADAAKAVEMAPNGIAIGHIILRGWQVNRLSPISQEFDQYASYLVRVNYEFDTAAEVPAPTWAEVEFTFPAEVAVLDAVPRAVTAPLAASTYQVNQHLNFVLRDGRTDEWWSAGSAASDIAMPAVLPRIEAFGIGGEMIRWRHTGTPPAPTEVGTHTGWLILLTPRHFEKLDVLAAGQYNIWTDPQLGLRPASRHDAFAVQLPAPSAPKASAAPTANSNARHGGPRVFISYAHESPTHKQSVMKLCQLLADHGVDVRIDQQDPETRRIWTDWTNTQILRSDYVIAIASPAYRAASENELPDDRNRGVRSEYLRLADLLHRYSSQWTKKLLPVVLPGRSIDEIPLAFLPGTADYYEVEDLTADGAAHLLQVLLSARSSN